jgi:hypothetical protein
LRIPEQSTHSVDPQETGEELELLEESPVTEYFAEVREQRSSPLLVFLLRC